VEITQQSMVSCKTFAAVFAVIAACAAAMFWARGGGTLMVEKTGARIQKWKSSYWINDLDSDTILEASSGTDSAVKALDSFMGGLRSTLSDKDLAASITKEFADIESGSSVAEAEEALKKDLSSVDLSGSAKTLAKQFENVLEDATGTSGSSSSITDFKDDLERFENDMKPGSR